MLINAIEKTINYFKRLTLWQVVLYPIVFVVILQLSVWLVEYVIERF